MDKEQDLAGKYIPPQQNPNEDWPHSLYPTDMNRAIEYTTTIKEQAEVIWQRRNK